MLANLFERFCVEVDTSFDKFDKLLEKYNLLSIDFGDGDNAACQVIWNPFDSKFEIKLLTFKKGVERYHTPNVLYQSNEQIELLSVDRLTSAAHIQEKTYCNFKTICDTFHEKEHYQGDNDSPTYEELMSHSFACIVKCLFENNGSLNPNKKTIIMVGRPSSALWSDCEQEYVKVLRHNIPNTQQILLVTIPESIAAMAGEIGMDQASWENGTKQIIDAGSSTFDLTTVSPQGTIPEGQDSFQFGGNQLDELLVHYGDLHLQNYIENQWQGCSERPEMGKKAKLRIKKELVYGDGGINLNIGAENYLYRLNDENGNEQPGFSGQPVVVPFVLSRAEMDIVLNNPKELDCLRTELCHQGGGFEDGKEPQVSWLSGCETVLRRFHEETKGLCKDGKSDVLILTGGVSNMPEVCSLAEKIFQPRKIIISSSPSTSVAKGLALVLANEIKKKWLLDKLYQTLDKKFPDVTNLREAAVEETCAVSLDCYKKTILAWANENENKTLRQCVDALTSPNNQFFDCNAFSISDLAEKWYSKNRIANKVMTEINNSFHEMFPNIQQQFLLSPMIFPDFKNCNVGAEPQINVAFFFDKQNEPDNVQNEAILDRAYSQAERKEMYQVFCRHKDILKTGGRVAYRVLNDWQEPGLRNHYQKKFESDEVQNALNDVYNALKAHCKREVSDFVESLTYYLTSANFTDVGGK